MLEANSVKVERDVSAVVNENKGMIEDLINETFSYSGIALGYSGGKWCLAKRPNWFNLFARTFVGFGAGDGVVCPFAVFNNPVDEEGNFVPIEIFLKERKYLGQVYRFAREYQSATGQGAKIVTAF